MTISEQALNNVKIRRIEAQEEFRRRTGEIEKIPEYAKALREFAAGHKKALGLFAQGRDSDFIEANETAGREFEKKKIKILTDNGYPADYLDIPCYCDKCRDTGHECPYCIGKERNRLYAEQIRENSALSANSTFDKINHEYYGEYRNQMEQIYNFCRKYADDFSLKSGCLLMSGKTGLGKTHFSLAIANEAAQKGYSVGYNSAIEMFMKIEDEHFRQNSNEYMKMLADVDLLVIDDLGTEIQNRFYVSSLYGIMEIRLNRKLPTIISTNLDIYEIEERYGSRLCSRLMNFANLKFVGKDIRQLKRQLMRKSGK